MFYETKFEKVALALLEIVICACIIGLVGILVLKAIAVIAGIWC
ncbi:hypothetical protein LMG18090_04035 [Ralstonia mannitolilytica]|nr:hypothetical protein LMG18090_04035 [Ralstonia mannitolilytica]